MTRKRYGEGIKIVKNQAETLDKKAVRRVNLLENLFVIILAFYPLRHISWGLDLWDTGYNYANFRYMGTEHMDSMWLFSTYLANVTGNFLTRLPNAGTLMGMNLYTGLFISLLSLTGYFFCTRSLKIPRWCAFLGELAAVSLCWCPTALLYNYMTYVFLLICIILLYHGLRLDKPAYLAAAGVCLGANVLVRFSNLPEAALILAVWAYDAVIFLRKREAGGGRRVIRHTLWCLLGYAATLVILLNYIHICYGFDNYVAGISRLFAMTEQAEDYRAAAMLMKVAGDYVENLYWAVRIAVILAAGTFVFAAADFYEKKVRTLRGRFLFAAAGVFTVTAFYMKGFGSSFLLQWMSPGSALALRRGILFLCLVLLTASVYEKRIITLGSRVLCVGIGAAMVVWLYGAGFCSVDFLYNGAISYGPILRPGILFLMLSMLIGLIRFFQKNSSPEEKFISAAIVLVLFITSLGSNNGVMPSMNNLFLAAPYTLWQSWRFLRNATEKRIGFLTVSAFPAKGILGAFLLMCLFQFGGFGAKFVFAEATGVQDISAVVENNEVLKNIKMSPEKAGWLTELSGYVNENSLRGREVILYGYVPSLSYYLQMPSAFNPWSDLLSYSYEAMEEAVLETERQMSAGGERPVVLADYTGEGLWEDAKWQLILDFMERNGYEEVWHNDRFMIWE